MLICIRNDSLQTLEVYFKAAIGFKSILMQPGDVKSVTREMLSEHILKLQKRRMLTLFNYN